MTITMPPGPWTSPAPTSSTRYRAMLALDITAFGARTDPDLQRYLREALYRITENACHVAGVPPAICHSEDRGDGILLIAPPCISAETLLDPLSSHLRAGVRRHNKIASTEAAIRLRAAVHAGQVSIDPKGASGPALIHLFRLLEAPQVKRAFTTAGAEFALVTSQHLYDDVIRHAPGLIDPAVYRRITVELKETNAAGWISLSPPADQADNPANSASAARPFLDPDDVEVAWRIGSGWSRARLAEDLGISVREAETRICRLLAKLCLTDPANIAATLATGQRRRRGAKRTSAP